MFGIAFACRKAGSPARLLAGWFAFGAALATASLSAAATEPSWMIPGADAARGRALVEPFGCAGCHTIPGVANARGNVGPPLTRFADRVYIAGMLHNRPDNLVRWLRDPQSVVPGNAMPSTGLTEAEARDVAAFLYTLR